MFGNVPRLHAATSRTGVKDADLARAGKSLPLDRPRRLTGHVINHAIDALHLVDDPRRHRTDKFRVERIKNLRSYRRSRSPRRQVLFKGGAEPPSKLS
jgi:hypothetical protein